MDRIKMGNFLTELRKEKDLSQTDLAEIIGVTFQAVSKWERGEAIPDISILEKLASFYSVSIDEIIKGEVSVKQIHKQEVIVETIQSKEENGFLHQKRIFGFWFALAYLCIYLLLGFCPFARTSFFSSSTINGTTTTVYVVLNYYKFIFSANFNLWNFFMLLQFLTTLGIIAFTMLFYACTTKKAFRSMYLARFIFIIINLATLFLNAVLVVDSSYDVSVGNYLIMIAILVSDILFLCLKPNRKSYILQDYQ
ncbi:MAG: helix-turn-helix domain-containing protein [Anaeroplasmataceae bacterium]|nr:helix-turn-helix domain-containing protein [Anaeroplasmataceae bacterium]